MIIPKSFRSCVLLLALGLGGCAHQYTRWLPPEPGNVKSNLITVQEFYARLSVATSNSTAIVSNAMIQKTGAGTNVAESAKTQTFHEWWKRAERGPGAYGIYSITRIRATGGTNQPGIVAQQNEANLKLMYGEEWNAITNSGKIPQARYIGLALSGGGIRSASFSTGVLQGLQEIGVLDDIGYLSTVSGGGYAGSWYMMHKDPDLLDPGSKHLYHLAQYGNYLSSSHYSQSTMQTLGNLGVHTACWPWYFGSQILTCFNINCQRAKYVYRGGIQEAFQYEQPLKLGNLIEPKSMAFYAPANANGTNSKPFWIINMHLALTGDTTYHRNRSGDAFELTPLRAGANSVGYVKVPPKKLRSSEYWMNPAFGVAASGAAVDARSLKFGTFGTYGLLFFNLDLGWYVNNWNYGWLKEDDGSWGKRLAFYATTPFPLYAFTPGYHFRTVTTKNSYLTDGGHFDNLGLYALVRRGCRLIIIADATQDPAASDWADLPNSKRAAAFADFRDVELKIKSDFGADIEMKWDDFQATLPLGARFGEITGASVFTGRVRNLPVATSNGINDEVRIIYIKAAYSQADQLLNAGGYIDAEKISTEGAVFPHDSTGNQFYSEQKVVAYRELARRTIHAAENQPGQHLFTDSINWAHRLNP